MSEERADARPSAWATCSDSSPELMTNFQDGLPVRLIATPRSSFKTCRTDEDLARVVERNVESFDYFPVVDAAVDARETIIGMIDLVPFMHGETPQGLVKDRMRRLSEDSLIGADASILAFVTGADRHSCRLVVSGSEISGLVSLSDLQKLPVRAALFAMITHAEITMASAIRREFNGSDAWIERLSPARQSKIQEEKKKSATEDTFVDSLLFTQFADKTTIIRKSPLFKVSKTAFEAEMQVVQNLRDQLAHANDYASTRAAAEQVCRTVRSIAQWIDWLTSWPAAGLSGGG
jgi:hypothetical protein